MEFCDDCGKWWAGSPAITVTTDGKQRHVCKSCAEFYVEPCNACPKCKEMLMYQLVMSLYFGPYSERSNQWVHCLSCGQVYEI
jgi:RNase P subunit RPR2